MKKKLTQEYLKEALTYNPDTGIFTWNERPISHFKNKHRCNNWNSRCLGVEAGHLHTKTKYVQIGIDGVLYQAHRLAFLYMEGYTPENEVDHIDRDPSNNRWVNLREVAHKCNSQNCNIRNDNKSGVCGVYYNKDSEKFVSQIRISGKGKYLGLFENFSDAVMRRYQEELNNPDWTCSVESTAYKYLKEHNLI